MENLLLMICEQMGLKIIAVRSKCRQRELVEARQMLCRLAHEKKLGSMDDMAKCLGIDNATVSYHIKQSYNLLLFNRHFNDNYKALNRLLETPLRFDAVDEVTIVANRENILLGAITHKGFKQIIKRDLTATENLEIKHFVAKQEYYAHR